MPEPTRKLAAEDKEPKKREPKKGLRLHQIRTLRVLEKAKAPIGRAKIAKDAGVSSGVIALALNGDGESFKGLVDLNLVSTTEQGVDGQVEVAYVITKTGKKAVDALGKSKLPPPHTGPGGGNRP